MIPNPQQSHTTRLRRVPSAAHSPSDLRVRLGAGTRNVDTCPFTRGRRWLEPQHLFVVPGRPILRRILAGLEVVRPRCAAGAPPRPRLRSTDITRGPERGQTTRNNLRIPNLYGGPQHR